LINTPLEIIEFIDLARNDLCFDIRKYLVLQVGVNSRELQPKGFYENG
jgi:hypothetical protein